MLCISYAFTHYLFQLFNKSKKQVLLIFHRWENRLEMRNFPKCPKYWGVWSWIRLLTLRLLVLSFQQRSVEFRCILVLFDWDVGFSKCTLRTGSGVTRCNKEIFLSMRNCCSSEIASKQSFPSLVYFLQRKHIEEHELF